MTVFLIIGAVGLLVLLLALLLGDVFDALDGLADAGGLFSTEAVAGFLGALGFGGALVEAVSGSTTLGWLAGVVLGLGAGAGAGWLARFLRADDDASGVRTEDFLERIGTVVGEIPDAGYGRVALTVGGHLTRVNATSSAPVATGTTVSVTSVLSPTSVHVEPLFT